MSTQITPQIATELLEYEPLTGILRWRERSDVAFNRQYAGKIAGSIESKGYRQIVIFGRPYMAHRLAWLIRYGRWPVDQLDHVNGNPDDNRLANLREVSGSENLRNQTRYKSNRSGMTGVSYCRTSNKWRAYINVEGKPKNLGFFVLQSDAITARKVANLKYGYHPNHGRES